MDANESKRKAEDSLENRVTKQLKTDDSRQNGDIKKESPRKQQENAATRRQPDFTQKKLNSRDLASAV